MLKHFQNPHSMFLKVTMGVILGLISLAMVITLVPGAIGSFSQSPDAVAVVGGKEITISDLNQYFDQMTRGQTIPPEVRRFYLSQVLDQMIFQDALNLEAQRLGMRVTDEDQKEEIKRLLPAAFVGDTWVGMDRYAAEVQERTGMSVPEFEELVRQRLLQDRFRSLVTAGITVTPEEIKQEFIRRNDKVKLDFVMLKPEELAASIQPTDQELAAYFAKNASRYVVPEERSARYALLDEATLQKRAAVTEKEVENYYNQHLDAYKVPDRVHVEHILFKTVGKTDAEVEEIQNQAEGVLRQAQHGANFEDLARKYSEDSSKDKGGDIGWIVRGQTVPQFEQAAFSLAPGSISGLVKTQYGFHIIKVLERENAHTKSLDEVRLSILSALSDQKTADVEDTLFNNVASAIRQSNRQSLDAVAKQFGMTIGLTPLADATQPVGQFGSTQELHDVLFHLRPGELSAPLRTDQGIVILSLKEDRAAHPATLAEVHDKVVQDYRRDTSIEMARTKAQELAKRVHGGASLAEAAKALGLAAQSTGFFAIGDSSVTGIGPAKMVPGAFKLQKGQTSQPQSIGEDWIVYTVTNHQSPNLADLPAQQADIEKTLLNQKKEMAFRAFHDALKAQLMQEGKIKIFNDVLKRATTQS